MSNKLVSIIVPCYNGERFINKFFDELLKQTYESIELIIVNDGSTDNSEKIIKSYEKKMKAKNWELVYIKQQNGGPGSAFNTGIKKITGEYISWIDIDDYYETDAIANLVDYLEKNKNIGIVRGKVRLIDYDTNKTLFIRGQSNPKKYDLFEDYLFVKKDAYVFSGIWMVRTKLFDERIKNRTIYSSKFGQNWQLLLPLLLNTKCGYVDTIVLNCFIRNDSISNSPKSSVSKINKNNGYHDILIHIIPELNISEKQKKHYLKKINQQFKLKNIKAKLINEKFINFLRQIKRKLQDINKIGE